MKFCRDLKYASLIAVPIRTLCQSALKVWTESEKDYPLGQSVLSYVVTRYMGKGKWQFSLCSRIILLVTSMGTENSYKS